MDAASWTPSLNLETPAGRVLRELVARLPKERAFTIAVFGSAPIQIMVDPDLLSADVDVFSPIEDLANLVEAAGLNREKADFYVQVSSELNFRTSPRWRERSQSITLGNTVLIFPHPIDILIAKLNRLDDKDLRAFEVVLAKTGHPTEHELLAELQMAVDLFRPSFDEEQGHDMANNCRRLWPRIYGREIDPRAEIIAPALAKRKAGYGEPSHDHKQELRDALRSATVQKLNGSPSQSGE
jgi:hypothetical protein